MPLTDYILFDAPAAKDSPTPFATHCTTVVDATDEWALRRLPVYTIVVAASAHCCDGCRIAVVSTGDSITSFTMYCSHYGDGQYHCVWVHYRY